MCIYQTRPLPRMYHQFMQHITNRWISRTQMLWGKKYTYQTHPLPIIYYNLLRYITIERMRGFHERDFVGIKKYTLDTSPYENVPPFVAIYHDRVDFIDERISRTKFFVGKKCVYQTRPLPRMYHHLMRTIT